jgi:uncharacterized membrane protein YgcG
VAKAMKTRCDFSGYTLDVAAISRNTIPGISLASAAAAFSRTGGWHARAPTPAPPCTPPIHTPPTPLAGCRQHAPPRRQVYKDRVLVGELAGDLDAARFEPELRDLIERARAGPSPPDPLRLVGFGATRRAFDEARGGGGGGGGGGRRGGGGGGSSRAME